TLFMSWAISRPWLAIQTLCQVSMPTARMRTQALSSSWPEPANNAPISLAKAATMQAPASPATTPKATQTPLPGTPLVAASTMPTMSPASMTSRKTMMSADSMLFDDHHALRRLGVEFAHERITARRQWAQTDFARATPSHDLLGLERFAVEFL